MNKINKTLTENPHLTEELKVFFTEVLLTSIAENPKIPKSFKDVLETNGVNSDMLNTYLTATPRLICDFMDAQGIIILITYKGILGFSYTINEVPSKERFVSRKEAETSAVISSITYYTEKSNQIDEEK